jgi:hypothetical protein
MAKRRRTQQIQRRTRASDEALSRPLRASRGLDPRLLIVGGVLVVGVILIVVALVVFSKPDASIGIAQADRGGTHIDAGTSPCVSQTQAGCNVRASDPNAYSSLPATSGPHWSTPDDWGVYTTPQAESQVVHNLEHGGIVVWYQPDKLDAAGVAQLTQWANQQLRGAQFKVILSPWSGADFGHPIAVTAWNYLLYQDAVDIGQISGFLQAHYQRSPEPNGGPAQPAL